MRIKKASDRVLSIILCAALLIPLLSSLLPVQAADKTFLLQQAQTLALANSSDISKISNEIVLQQMNYVEAVKGIQAKVKNLKSFRWSPLLTFKFPQQLTLTQEFELNVKPLTLQAEIDTLRHEMNDLRFQVLDDVNKLYTQLYVTQEKIDFDEDRLVAAKDELSKNQARLLTGNASQDDITKMQASVDKLTSELSELKRSFEADKKTLSDMIKLDVTSGYVFKNSLKTASIPREDLESLISYTLSNDQSYYETCMKASTALLNLTSYESLMRNQYGSKMDPIQNYINMAKQGMDIDYAAFKIQYNAMLTNLDAPWAGKLKILFFTFTMEWFKGEIAGTRYIEDEMYAVYTACMEYASAKKEKDSAEKELRARVASSYESLVTAYNAYADSVELTEDSSKTLSKVSVLNKLGKAEYSELKDARDSYQEMQLETVGSLASYNELLYDFDRLTCGAVTKYFSGADIATSTGPSGDSFSTVDPIKDPYYYIYSSVSNLTFYIGVSIPKDYDPEITAFEVWMGDTQIGNRTEVGKELRHLALDYKDSSEMTIRLYNGKEYVTECVIDASVPRAVLPIEVGEKQDENKEIEVGSYSVETTPIGKLSTSKLTLKLNSKTNAKFYSISYGESGNVYSSDKLDVEKSLSYLTILIVSLSEVKLSLYDAEGNLAATGRFDTSSQKIYATPAASQ